MVRNYMEHLLNDSMTSILANYKNDEICTCELCLDDIKAIALNHLKPLYIVTQKGEVYSRINELVIQFEADITNEVTKAIGIVAKNPRHD